MPVSEQDDLFVIDLKPRVALGEDFINALSARAEKERSRYTSQLVGAFFAVTCIAFMLGLFGVSPYGALVAFALVGFVVGWSRTRAAESAFRKRHYDRVFKILPGAISWTSRWSPLTIVQLLKCDNLYSRLLIAEGRFLEYESVVRYAWALQSKGESTASGAPKNAMIANNLSITLLGQQHFEAAAQVLEETLRNHPKGAARGFMLNNLTLCLIKLHRVVEAEKCLAETRSVNGDKRTSPLGSRIELLHAMLCLEKKDWKRAEALINDMLAMIPQLNESAEFHGETHFLLAQCLAGQGRVEEAEFAFRNCIDLVSSAPNPSQLLVAECLSTYARFIRDQGREREAADLMVRAHDCVEFAYQRDLRTLAALKERLADPKPIQLGTELADATRLRAIERTK